VEELSVTALVPVDEVAYQHYADQESVFAMVIPFAPGLRQLFMSHHQQRDTWELPSGKVEPGESPTRAAERELLEEAGARVDQLRPLGILLTRLGQVPGQGHLYWGEVTQWTDLPRGSEMDEVRGFSPDMWPAQEQMAPVTRWVVRWLGDKLIATHKEGVASWTWG
jgi:8-oxo-dGTP pyrophosphatase MutT (NUDIX family)